MPNVAKIKRGPSSKRESFALSAMLTVELVCVAISDTHLYGSIALVQSLLEYLDRTVIHQITVCAWILHISNKSGYLSEGL